MRGSLQIARLFGIPVFIHWSFSFLLLFIIYIGKSRNGGWEFIAFMALSVMALFACVVLHEFGHALSARYFGVRTQDITILPIGGVARLDRLPEKPFQEFVVAIAGPAVNVVICILLGLILLLFYDLPLGLSEMISGEINEIITNPLVSFLATLMQANFWLVIFNMVPAFPMDGGRVFRALLSMRLGRTWATKIASILGQVIAVGFLIFALLPLFKGVIPESTLVGELLLKKDWGFQPVLAFISVFIVYTARNEYKQVRMDEILKRHTIGNILRPYFMRLKTGDLIQTAISEMKKGTENNFLVFDDKEILRGILQEEDIIDAAKNKHYDALVFTYMTHEFRIVTPYESIKEVYYRMLQSGQYIMPVMKEDTLIGVVDMRMLENFIQSHETKKII